MHQSKPIEPKAGHELVVDKVLALAPLRIILAKVPADRQNVPARRVDGYNIRQPNARRLPTLVTILVSGDIKVTVALIKRVILRIPRGFHARDLVRLLLDLIALRLRRRLHVQIPVETCHLLLAKVVLRHPQNVRHTLRRHQIPRRVRDDQILRQDVWRHSPLQVPVIVDLLERRSAIPKVIQHLVVVGIILLHLDRDLIVHVILYALGLRLLLRRGIPSNLRPNRTARRQHFLVSLRLKLRHRLIEKRMNDTSRTVKRFCAFLIRKAKERKPLLIRLFPVIPARIIILNQPTKFLTDLSQISVRQNRSQIVAKPNRRYVQRLDVPAKNNRRPAILIRRNAYLSILRGSILLRKIDLHSRTLVHRDRIVRKGLRNSRVRCGH